MNQAGVIYEPIRCFIYRPRSVAGAEAMAEDELIDELEDAREDEREEFEDELGGSCDVLS